MTTQKTPLPDQPDGICARNDDDMRIPSPVDAAKRVDAYVREAGDGLYDAQGGAPLYARDLAALTCSVLHGYTASGPSRCVHDPRPVDPADLRVALTRFLTGRAIPGGAGPDRLLSPDEASHLAYSIAERFPTGTVTALQDDGTDFADLRESLARAMYEAGWAARNGMVTWERAPSHIKALFLDRADAALAWFASRAAVAQAADVVEGEVWAWLNEVDAPWSPSDGKVRAFASRLAVRLAPQSPVVSAEGRLAVARVFAAARSGADHVAFYEDSDSPMWHRALAEADEALSAAGVVVASGGDR